LGAFFAAQNAAKNRAIRSNLLARRPRRRQKDFRFYPLRGKAGAFRKIPGSSLRDR
jgi:hypothetical protein